VNFGVSACARLVCLGVSAGLGGGVLVGCPSERLPGYYDPAPLSDASPDADDVAAVLPAPDIRATQGEADGAGAAVVGVEDGDRLPTFVALFKRLSPAVVNIYTQEVVERRNPVPWLSQILPLPGEVGTSLGSGMVLDFEGHILTNAHVVENAAEIRVRFFDGLELPAGLVGIDLVRDLAVLKVDGAAELVPVVRGDSNALEVGAWVVAIGNPFGLSHTITKGIVSGKGRSEFVNERVGYLDLIQTDAAINQGSSGGPLFDLRGRVVGINTAVNSEGHGIGFAIGWEAVEEALPRLLQGGHVSRSWLGVYVKQDGDEAVGRVRVDAVVEDSPATRAGLLPEDVVVALDDKPIRTVAEFRLRVASAVAGREMALAVERGGLPVRLTARPEEARDIR
jgi:serine protease Do